MTARSRSIHTAMIHLNFWCRCETSGCVRTFQSLEMVLFSDSEASANLCAKRTRKTTGSDMIGIYIRLKIIQRQTTRLVPDNRWKSLPEISRRPLPG